MANRQENVMTGRTWIVVADSSHASIYLREQRNSPVKTVASMDDADAHTADASADSRKGHAFQGDGEGRGRSDIDAVPRRNGSARFAREVVERVERGRSRGEFRELILIAPPRLLGLMRGSLTRRTLDHVSREIPKNLVALEPERIKPYLNGLDS